LFLSQKTFIWPEFIWRKMFATKNRICDEENPGGKPCRKIRVQTPFFSLSVGYWKEK